MQAQRTLFNLVPCNNELEVALTTFLDRAADVAAFAKNAGPQALRLDYVNSAGQLGLYTPDFIVRTTDRNYVLIETKGREDPDVPLKARAAVAWCEAATKTEKRVKWDYLYIPQGIFGQFHSDKLADLMRACAPSLSDLLEEKAGGQLRLALDDEREKRKMGLEAFIDPKIFFTLPSRDQQAISQAVALFEFLEHKENITFGPVFQSLLGPLEDAARGVILERLLPALPAAPHDQQDFFEPYLGDLPKGQAKMLAEIAKNLRRTLVYRNGLFPLGLLAFCLEHARDEQMAVGGVFAAIRKSFADLSKGDFTAKLNAVKEFRNKYIAHAEEEL
ncbi:MAG: restriction endonuclease subunit R, partial [Firmicutes bacterium]|nr:restriction endonuclease subunit R [Bacillota bacterium]